MPRLPAWGVRLALVHLALGASLGSLLLVDRAAPIHPALGLLLPVHGELLLVGWLLQLAMAVALWILPRNPAGPRPGLPAGGIGLVSLNLGIWTRVAGHLSRGGAGWSGLGRGLELLAVVVLAIHLWPRIRSAQSPSPD